MIGLVYSENDAVSRAAGESILMKYSDNIENWRGFSKIGEIVVCKSKSDLLHCEYLDGFGFESIIFMSRHKSKRGIVSFTAHPMGNWMDNADLGGEPRHLSVSEPIAMRNFLLEISKKGDEGIDVVYEATHHGPLLKTPSCFMEFGGPESALENTRLGQTLGEAAFESANKLCERISNFSKVVIGLGGTHYPRKFTKLAIERGYAFAHIMPKHAIINSGTGNNLDMIDAAVESSRIEPECAVVDWKSLDSDLGESVIKRLDELGLDYERI